jgi:hypothetical protein
LRSDIGPRARRPGPRIHRRTPPVDGHVLRPCRLD